jgi:hypothetical protein
MPLFKGKASKAKPKRAIDYITRPDKAVIISSLSMDDSRGYAEQFRETCDIYGKGSGYDERKHYHFKLSIDRADNPSPQQSHELAEKMASQLFAAHECVIATHSDTGTIHSHIIVNAVSFETGKKLHMNIKEYQSSKDLADTLGVAMGFTPLDWRTKTAEKLDRIFAGEAVSTDKKNLSQAERNIEKHGNLNKESWKEALRIAIDEAKAHCIDRVEFERYLIDYYNVIMPRNTKKTISFVHPAVGEKFTIRGTKLGADYTTDSIDKALQANKKRSELNAGLFTTEEQPATAEPTAPNPNITTIISQPTSQERHGKRSAPRSVSDVSAELRSIGNAINRITNPVQQESGGTDSMASKPVGTSKIHNIHRHGNHQENDTTGRKKSSSPVVQATEHERSVQQKPKRRSYSHER